MTTTTPRQTADGAPRGRPRSPPRTSSPATGLHGASTEDIAAAAGISQPYLFRLFGTKKELFLATVERCMAETAGDLPRRQPRASRARRRCTRWATPTRLVIADRTGCSDSCRPTRPATTRTSALRSGTATASSLDFVEAVADVPGEAVSTFVRHGHAAERDRAPWICTPTPSRGSSSLHGRLPAGMTDVEPLFFSTR